MNPHGCLSSNISRTSTFAGKNFLPKDRKSTRLNSSHSQISYAVFCLKKNNDSFGANSDGHQVIGAAFREFKIVGRLFEVRLAHLAASNTDLRLPDRLLALIGDHISYL